ncbi:MAG: hypothetical protein AAGE18_05840 [Pseudomonadota bacterium]
MTDGVARWSRHGRLVRAGLLASLLVGCAAGGVGPSAPLAVPVLADQPLYVPAQLPVLATNADRSSSGDVIEAAQRIAGQEVAGRRGTTRVSADQVPLLYLAPIGRSYRALSDPRVLVRGAPAASCPALVATSGATAAVAAEQALSTCATDLAAAGADGDCGCQILAVNDTLLAEPDAFAYATGVPARLFRNGELSPLTLIAEEDADGTLTIRAGDQVLYRISGRPVGPVEIVETAAAETRAFSGARRPTGLLRGRFVQRIEAEDSTGDQIVLVVGLG